MIANQSAAGALSRISADDLLPDTSPMPMGVGDESNGNGLRNTRQRTALFSSDNLAEVLNKYLAKDETPASVRKHVSSCVDELTRKTEKSVRLRAKAESLTAQADSLHDGKVPSGIRPFKAAIETPELDLNVPFNFPDITIKLDPGCTFRAAKEKLYYAYIGMNKALDAKIIEAQLAKLRTTISRDHFIGQCSKFSDERHSAATDFMAALGLDAGPSTGPIKISREKMNRMYDSVMEKLAENKIEEEKLKKKSEETIAKKIERLRECAPQELLDMKIAASIQDAIKKSSKKDAQKAKQTIQLDGSIDYGKAYSMVMCGDSHLLPDAVTAPPPGLENVKTSFRGTKPHKGKEKGKGKGKGKDEKSTSNKQEPKDKGKGKGKGKSSTPKSKGGGRGAKHAAKTGGKGAKAKGRK